MRISDWSSDVCSSDLVDAQQNLAAGGDARHGLIGFAWKDRAQDVDARHQRAEVVGRPTDIGEHAVRHEGDAATPTVENLVLDRSEEHTSELQSLMRISYAVFCLKKKNNIMRLDHYRPHII